MYDEWVLEVKNEHNSNGRLGVRLHLLLVMMMLMLMLRRLVLETVIFLGM